MHLMLPRQAVDSCKGALVGRHAHQLIKNTSGRPLVDLVVEEVPVLQEGEAGDSQASFPNIFHYHSCVHPNFSDSLKQSTEKMLTVFSLQLNLAYIFF